MFAWTKSSENCFRSEPRSAFSYNNNNNNNNNSNNNYYYYYLVLFVFKMIGTLSPLFIGSYQLLDQINNVLCK